MQTRSDAELLCEYAQGRSEAAFGEIVRRYADIIYSTALRQTGDVEEARDVAQTVFADLARKAGRLPPGTVPVGWLFRGVRLTALELRRKDQRRQQRERQAVESFDPSPETPDDWHSVRPVLDEAIATLGHEDRDALLLRFFKNESLATVGSTLGVSEDAAQKRVARALDKLRKFLAGRGITTTATALSATLVANAVQIAPAGFVSSATAAALVNTAGAISPAAPTLKWFTFSPMKTLSLALLLTGGLAGLTVKHFQSQRQLRQAHALIQQQQEQIDALRNANEQLAGLTNQIARWQNEARDVLRLRGELTQLQRQLATTGRSLPTATGQVSTNQNSASTVPQVDIRARFVSVPTNVTFVADGIGSLLDDSEVKTFSEAEFQSGDLVVLNEARVIKFSCQQAQIQSIQSVTNIDAQSGSSVIYTNIGATLDVFPECSTNSSAIGLTFVARVTDLLDEGATGNQPQPTLFSLDISNSVAVASGRTVVVAGKLPGGGHWTRSVANTNAANDGPRQLLVFLKPTIANASSQPLQTTNEPAQVRYVNPADPNSAFIRLSP